MKSTVFTLLASELVNAQHYQNTQALESNLSEIEAHHHHQKHHIID